MNELSRREKILEYFREPNEENSPEAYIRETERSVYLVRVVEKLFPDKTISILELGSGVGRNLHFLKVAGYFNLYGIEQSPLYLEAMNEHYPELSDRVIDGTIEDVLPNIESQSILIFTMAVLEHVPYGPIFDVIPKRSNFLLTIEDEVCNTWNHFPRNYKDVFESRGSKQVKVWKYPPLGPAFVMRLFKNKEREKNEVS